MTIEFFCEIGSNYITEKGHDLNRAYKLIDEAVHLGCTGVKFQYYTAEKLWHPDMKKELKIASQRELPFTWVKKLSKYTRDSGLLFGLSVFDIESIKKVNPYVDYFKIASFEAGWFELVKACYKTGKRLMISLGQTDKEEMLELIERLPNGKNIIDFLHCVNKYPAVPDECNLAILKDNPWINGWSDHTCYSSVIYTAVGMGAKVIEFHLDLDDKKGVETDHSWNDFSTTYNMITHVTYMEKAIGSSNWDDVIAQQDRTYKANPITGLRGK